MPTVECKYTVYGSYSLPKSVKLLSVEENKKKENWGKPFSWYIIWDTLHYFDAEGKEHTVDGGGEQYDWKRPDDDSEAIYEDDHAEEDEE
jgi:hypothetical protein